jgi:tripartite-type tricarboxylate transporter receptor subunit TctC
MRYGDTEDVKQEMTRGDEMRNVTRLIAVLYLALAATVCAAAEAYPQRPLRFIVPFPPGGANDIVARLLGPKLTERLGQQIVVDNRPGASGSIALELTARAQPDGYTFIVGNNTSNSIVPVLYADRMKVVPAKDLTGISLLAAIPHGVVAAAKFPPNTFQELIAYARARPGQLNYNAPRGGHPHLDMLALLAATGTNMVHIPSKGAGETIPSILRGEAHVSNTNVASVIGLIRAGQLKVYAVTSESRLAELPNVPTFAEVGLKGVGSINWVGLFAPAKTPPAIINKLHATIVDILSQPELKETYAKRLVPLAYSASPAEFNAFVASEMQRWVKIVRDNNIRLE